MKKDNNWKIKLERIKRSKLWAGDMARVAVRILNYLEDNKRTQKWLAEQLDVSPQQVNKIVKGKQNMSWGKIREIENVLGINLAEISECDYLPGTISVVDVFQSIQTNYNPFNAFYTPIELVSYLHDINAESQEYNSPWSPVEITPAKRFVIC